MSCLLDLTDMMSWDRAKFWIQELKVHEEVFWCFLSLDVLNLYQMQSRIYKFKNENHNHEHDVRSMTNRASISSDFLVTE